MVRHTRATSASEFRANLALHLLNRGTENTLGRRLLPEKGKPVVRRGRKATGQKLGL